LATDERGGSLEGGVHGGVAQPEGNDGEGRCPVVEVYDSWLRKVVGTQAVIWAASTERVGGQRRLVPVTPSRWKQTVARRRVTRGRGPTRVAMRAAAPVGGAQGFSGGAVRGTPVREEAALGGQGSGDESRVEWTTRARLRGGDGGKKGETRVRRAPFIAAQGGGRRAAWR
jgi:hypothetical protein